MKSTIKYIALAVTALVIVSMIVWGGLAAPRQQAQGAVLTVPTMFTNDAILQRNMAVPVWGAANAGDQVTVSFNGQVKTTNAASDGKWRVDLDPMAATTAPRTMTITGSGSTITVSNVQVGEVWLCSGQSNMWFNLNNAVGATAAKADVANHNLSIFQVGFNEMTIDRALWAHATPDNVGGTSAVCYFFAHTLSHALGANLAIGLLQAAKGGTDIVEWTHAAGGAGDGALYDAKIAPMQPYAIRGAAWYQGENDAADPAKAAAYATNLAGLINEWRTDWSQGNFPFGIVQLHWAPNGGAEGWAIVRNAQLNTWLTVPNTFLGTAVDLPLTGQPGHPESKEPVGLRLGLGARALVYGENIPYSGPVRDPSRSYIAGNKIVVAFNHDNGDLITKDAQAPTAFKVAGADSVYYDATAQIVGDTVEVSSPAVPNPVSVRYVWNYVQGNLARNSGFPETFGPIYSDKLPALPFEMSLAGGPTPTPTPVPTAGPSPTPTNTPILPTATPTPTPGGATVMHVQDIYTTDASGNPQSTFTAGNPIYYRVQIVDQFSAPVSGATVSTALIKPGGQQWTTQTATTGADGWALFTKTTTKSQAKGLYTINVTNVTKTGATYNAGANVKSSTTFTIQ